MSIYKGDKRIASVYKDHEIEHASEQHAGIIQIATQDETQQGVNDSKAITPKKLKHLIDTNINNYNLSKMDEYLYTIHYNPNQLDYQYAVDYFENNYYNIPLGGCTSLRKDNYFGRNYDWYYSNSISFVVKKEASSERYASIGIAGGLQSLTKDIVESNQWNDMYKILPFFLLDGINEHGVTISMNVVPVDQKGKTTGTHPDLHGDIICALMLPSYILDKFKTAREAINWILNEGKIYAPYNETVQQELHFLIADKTDTFVIEFVNNEAILIEDKNYITNFYLDGVEFTQDGKVDYNTVTSYGQGLERYNKITEIYDSLNTQNDILNLMRSLNYTNAYNTEDLQNWWKTEFVAPYADKGEPFPNLTVTTPVDEFESSGLIETIEQNFETRTRDNQNTWQTVHTSVYDIDKKQFLLITQEQGIDKIKTFQLMSNIGDGKLIITQDGEQVGEYSANTHLDTTINIDLSNIELSIDTHINNTTIHVTANDKVVWSKKQNAIEDLETIRTNAKTGADLVPQVTVNTQRIEELTTSKLPNATPIGTPHIVGSFVSGFSDTNYMLFPFTDISRGYPFDIYFSFTTDDDITTQQNILDSYFGIALAIQNSKGIMALSSNGANWDIGTSTGTNILQPNTTYYVKYSWTGTEYNASLSTNEQSYVPDMVLPSNKSPHKTTIYIGGSPNLFGPNSAHPFKGTINFKDAKVVVQGIDVWYGYADVGFQTRANVSLSNLDEAGESRFTNLQNEIDTKANSSDLTSHTTNDTIHVTANDKTTWNGKQNTIDDLDDIRDGASKGATAYQKPSTGIPKTDLASAVQTSLGKADTAIQSTDDCVKTSGNQTISGVKTFSNAGYGTGGVVINNTDGGASTVKFMSNSVKKGLIGVDASSKPVFEDNGTNITNLVRSTRNTAVGSSTKPVYVDSNGVATAITSYEGNSATATKATQDSDGNAINSTYLKKSGGTLTGALTFANTTMNLVGDDCYLGDQNIGGQIVIKGANGNTGITFQPYSGSTSQSITTNGSGTMTVTGTLASTFSGNLTGNATTSTTATNANNLRVTEHSANNIVYYPIWANGEGGTNRQCYVTKDKLNFTPSSGKFMSTQLSVNNKVTMNYNATTEALEFTFS